MCALISNLIEIHMGWHWKAVFLPSPLISERWKDTCLRDRGKLKFFGSEIGNSPFRMVNMNMHMGYFLLNEGLIWSIYPSQRPFSIKILDYLKVRILYSDLAEMLHSHIYIENRKTEIHGKMIKKKGIFHLERCGG